MEVFLENIKFMLPATGNKILDSVVNEQDTTSPKVEFELNNKYVLATAYLQKYLFVIKKGSEGKASVSPSLYATLQEKRNVLIQKGVFKLEGDNLIMVVLSTQIKIICWLYCIKVLILQ